MQNGRPFNIPLQVDLHIEEFSNGAITRIESGMTNMVVDQYNDGRWYSQQRPGINMKEDASATVSDARGRGCHYWDQANDRYLVNNDTVYKGSYSGSTMTISTGTERVFIEAIGSYLVIIDYENNEGWYIAAGAPTVINAITDTDFPPNQTPALTLARGGAVLNGKLYVLTTDGDIYESDIEDPTSWGGLNFRNAEIEPDDGVVIDKHGQHIAVWGSRTLEFFQDTANATGSTLSPRTDINYDIGIIDEDAWFRIGDNVCFVGQDRSNAISVYMLSGFQLRKISQDDLDTFLTTSITQDSSKLKLCGFTSGGREFVVLTLHTTPSDISATETVVFSSRRGYWGFWDVQLPDVDLFPLIDWMPSAQTRTGEGILSNGDLIDVQDDFVPEDAVAATGVFASGVFASGVFISTAAVGNPMPFEIVTGVITGNIARRKFMGSLYSIHNPTNTTGEEVTIAFSDDEDIKTGSYQDHGTIDVSDVESRLTSCGSFKRRNVKLSGTLTKQYPVERLEAYVR